MNSDIEALLDPNHPTKRKAIDWACANLRQPGAGRVDRELWQRAGDFGVLGLKVPTELGGSATSATDIALTFEGFGASGCDLGESFALATQTVVANRTLAAWGTVELHDRWFPGLVNGAHMACFAMSELDAGSAPWDMETNAVPADDGGWILNGHKTWSTLAPIADIAVVFALTDREKQRWGLSAFALPLDVAGVSTQVVEKVGLTAAPFGELHFDNVRLGPEALLGRVGSGAAIFTAILEFERALLYALEIGATEHLIGRTIERARSRVQGRTHIGAHQAVSHRIVDMVLAHESARALLYRTTLLMDRDRSATQAAAMTKLAASEMAVQGAIDAMRTFGTLGYTAELGLDLRLLDALGGLSYSGTPDISRNLIASLLGLDRPL